MSESTLIRTDLEHIWHPCSQMKDYEAFKPLIIKSAQGSYIELSNGQKVIDAISSWWCKSLGHAHPKIKQALLNQVEQFEHVIFANTTNATIVKLSERLAKLTTSLNKVMYASDGSCAVEIAMKMSLHSRQITNEKPRTKFIALSNSYHGETLATLSVSDIGIYKSPYQSSLFDCYFITNIPYINNKNNDLWHNCEDYWKIIEKQLEPYTKTATAIIVEPILQGAGGMKMYSKDLLQRLRQWANKHNVHLIADEIMTGIGRSGRMLACEWADIEADFVCLSKGLTSGWLPLSAVLLNDEIYQLFYDDYDKGKNFLHSHTHSGNVLAASVALKTLEIFEEENILDNVKKIEKIMLTNMQEVADNTGKLTNIRSIGAMVAADLVTDDTNKRLGFAVYQKAVKLGALLRPLGNTIYWLPPLNTSSDTLDELKLITQQAVL